MEDLASEGPATRKSPVRRRRLKKLLKYALGALGALGAFAVVYLAAALLLGIVPVNEDFRNADDGTEIYLVSNGIHVDFVLPVRSRSIDWSELFPREGFGDVNSSHDYVSFGWGERIFFVETPTWSDVRAWTVAAAMLWPTSTAMHVRYISQKPSVDESTRRVVLSEEQYQRLVDLIRESFRTAPDGRVQEIPGKSYGDTDNFYEGTGTYHVFNTCNMWTNRILKETGVRTAAWSPFTEGILYHLDRDHAENGS